MSGKVTSNSFIHTHPHASLPSEVEVVASIVGEHPVDVSCSNDPNDVHHGHLVHQTRRHHQEEEVTHQHSSKQSAHTPAGKRVSKRGREEVRPGGVHTFHRGPVVGVLKKVHILKVNII